MHAPVAFARASASAVSSSTAAPTASAPVPALASAPALPRRASSLAPRWSTAAPTCIRFASNEDAFRWVLAHDPAILAIGEAHAQKGTEAIASATKRFTDSMVSLLENRASDLLVEAWAGDPKCQKASEAGRERAKAGAAGAGAENPNEYVALGTRAKALGVQPHLLRPSCDDYASLADAGADVVSQSLGLIKRLTQSDATTLFRRNETAKNGKVVVTYGGAMHNDLAPSENLRQYSFGPELATTTAGRYVELDLIVPEYVKPTEIGRSSRGTRRSSPTRAPRTSRPSTASPTTPSSSCSLGPRHPERSSSAGGVRIGERVDVLLASPGGEARPVLLDDDPQRRPISDRLLCFEADLLRVRPRLESGARYDDLDCRAVERGTDASGLGAAYPIGERRRRAEAHGVLDGALGASQALDLGAREAKA